MMSDNGKRGHLDPSIIESHSLSRPCPAATPAGTIAAPAIEEERHDVGGGFVRTQPRAVVAGFSQDGQKTLAV